MKALLLPALLAMATAPAPASAQALLPCEQIEATSRPGMVPATGYAAVIEGGMLRRIVLTLANGQRTTTEFTPMGDGVSVRLVTFPDPREAARVTAVFNRATVSTDGTVLVETWLRRAEDSVPAHNFYRLRCAPGGVSK
ncbi:hypothetical protein [Neoroseomonas soli]|uniref:Uncharacterized protein n=1 Tax=Neoroseomonas soli TaxID=1081025 RepID=A0A9X9WXQ0_9PROT|nr:hypothetical protein [Neoroseomonas soli]MBR0671929.1 hypothetical protein [Neoroseomonas soli]